MDFPFYDAPDTASITCCHIVDDGKPILYVSHDEDDGMWQFLCGSTHETAEARLVSLEYILIWIIPSVFLKICHAAAVAERKNAK